MAHEIEGRRGYFLVVNEDGFESDFLTPANADKEATRMIFDARGQRRDLSVVWCFWDEQGIGLKALPVYHEVGGVSIAELELPKPKRGGSKLLEAKGVWQGCEEYLFRMNCPRANAGAKKPQL